MSAFVADLHTSLAPRTITRYESAFALFARFLDEVSPDAALAIDELSRDLLVRFHGWLSRKDTGRHEHARGLYTTKRIVEKVEAAWKWLDESGFDDAVPRARTIKMKREPWSPPDAPTWDEMAACVMSCVSEGPRRVATILYFTGVRTEQAYAALWEHVDVERATMFVPPHKGLPGRIIPLSPHFVAELATWGKREGLLCGWDVSDKIVRQRLSEAWARARVRTAAWSRAPGKAFRRGVTTGLEMLGVPASRAEAYLGRVSPGARKFYLAVGMLPLGDVAAAFPKIEAATVVALKQEA